MSGPGNSGITVDYLREEIKLLQIHVALQKREREVELAEAALRASYAEEVYGRHVLAVCVDFIIPGFGTTYIAVFEDNEGAKNLAQNPTCTSNSKHHIWQELFWGGSCWVIRV